MVSWKAPRGLPTTVVVVLEAEANTGPTIVTEVAAPTHLRILQDDVPRLWAAGSPQAWGLCAFIQRPFEVLHPIVAAECRRIHEAHPDAADWWTAWAFQFAEAISSTGPIGPGSWWLQRAEIGSPDSWVPNFERAGLSFVYVEHDAEQNSGSGLVEIQWGISGTNAYLPMRSLDETDEGRLKAFRKLAREGLLPPVLLWWHSGLQCSVVLDGHVRFEAFRSAGVPIRALLLSSIRTHGDADAVEQFRNARAAQFDRHIKDPVVKNRVLTDLYHEPMAIRFVSAAKPMPGGAAAWTLEVELESTAYARVATKWLGLD